MDKVNAEIIVGKCGTSKKLFGIRAEETQHKKWGIDWAFALSEGRARSEGYEGRKIEGSFYLTDKYPGCPYCGKGSFFLCGHCGKVTCWQDEKSAACAHCGKVSNISGEISQIDTAGDV